MKMGQQSGTEHNKHRPEDESSDDAPKQNPMLVSGLNTEIGEDDGEYEQIVDRQRLLDQIAGQELKTVLSAKVEINEGIKEQSYGNPNGAPGQCLPCSDRMRLAVEDE